MLLATLQLMPEQLTNFQPIQGNSMQEGRSGLCHPFFLIVANDFERWIARVTSICLPSYPTSALRVLQHQLRWAWQPLPSLSLFAQVSDVDFTVPCGGHLAQVSYSCHFLLV